MSYCTCIYWMPSVWGMPVSFTWRRASWAGQGSDGPSIYSCLRTWYTGGAQETSEEEDDDEQAHE